eukprot:2113651-Pyramimonas_sp.AAC.1
MFTPIGHANPSRCVAKSFERPCARAGWGGGGAQAASKNVPRGGRGERQDAATRDESEPSRHHP